MNALVRKISNFLKAPFAWKHVCDAGIWSYWENEITGARHARKLYDGCYGPEQSRWLTGGLWDETRSAPPGPMTRRGQ
jgi:hypothetical protein